MKKLLLILLSTLILCGFATIGASAAFLGTGSSVLAKDVSLIKTGLIGEAMTFSDTDFKTALGISTFKKITVLSLPSSDEGTLTLDNESVKVGQQIKRRNITGLTFTPKDSSVTESSFSFCVSAGSEETVVCTMKFISRVNYAPKIVSSAENSLNVTTQKGISVYGTFKAEDPEGDDIDYIIVSAPKYGAIAITDLESGEFKYTPSGDFCGNDSFVFVVRDEYGNFSQVQKVSIRIIERMSEVVFVDMKDSKDYNAAVAMSAMGIMSGEIVGDDTYFAPDGSVSRAEFVAMAMKSLSIRADSTLESTFFDDNDEIPKSLVGYVATAARCGIVNGSFENGELKFRPNDPITHYEAAIVMANLINTRAESEVFSAISGIESVPVWARAQVGAMYTSGIFSTLENIEMNESITRENAAKYLYKLCNLK